MLRPVKFEKKLFGFSRKQVVEYIGEIDDKVLELEKSNEKLGGENVMLVEKLGNISREYDELQESVRIRVEQIREMLEQANSDAEQAFERLENDRAAREDFERRAEAMGEIVANARTAIELADQKLSTMKSENDRLTQENVTLKDQAEELLVLATESSKKLDVIIDENFELRAKYDEAYAKASQVSLVEERASAVNAENKSLVRQLNESKIEIRVLTEKLDELIVKNNEVVKEVEGQKSLSNYAKKQEMEDLVANAKKQADLLLSDARVKTDGIFDARQETHETIKRAKDYLLEVSQKLNKNVDGIMGEVEDLRAESEMLAKNATQAQEENGVPKNNITHIRSVSS